MWQSVSENIWDWHCLQWQELKYTFRGCRGAKFVLATLGNDAGMYGSAKLVLEQ